MLTLYRRHRQVCQKKADRYWKRCDCPMWVEGTVDSHYIRRSLKTTSWQRASGMTAKMEEAQQELRPKNHMEAEKAIRAFLQDARDRELKQSSMRKYEGVLERSFLPWLRQNSYRRVSEIDLPALRLFRSTWQNSARTKSIKQAMLSELMRFCVSNGWADKNPVPELGSIRVKHTPTDYVTQPQFIELIDATERYDPHRPNSPHGKRLKTLLLLMRWSGLRIGDAVTLAKDRLQGDLLFLYMAKTGVPVFVPLPDEVVKQLHELPSVQRTNPRYFFWSGNGSPDHVSVVWQRAFRGLVRLTTITKRIHPHMIRDTFAVELLLAGVPIERVSILLGHSSVGMTERHYAPWIKARQEQLIADVRSAWLAQSGVNANHNTLGDT